MAKQVLGRGLESLLGEMNTAYNISEEYENNTEQVYLDIDIDNIEVNPYQPRKHFDEEKLEELSQSIIDNGLLQPIIVTKNNDKYIIVAGERRFRASRLANKSKIKAIILEVDKSKLRELALIENLQRDDLNIIEIAQSYDGLIQDYDITHEELSKIVSKSRSSISNILRLLTLNSYTKQMIVEQKISQGHAKLLVSLEDIMQTTITKSIIGQKLSVRDTEFLIKNFNKTNTTKNKSNNNSFDYKSLDIIKDIMNDNNLEIKIDKNYFKIKISSQEDIEKITAYFNNK